MRAYLRNPGAFLTDFLVVFYVATVTTLALFGPDSDPNPPPPPTTPAVTMTYLPDGEP